MNSIEEIYREAKADKWFKRFAIFCRVALAISFLPAGIVKIMGERFAEGLPHNHPLGHYFDALLTTGYYYTFLGITQVIIAVLLLIPRTALLGALLYFPVIINITVLTYATRFDGTRIITFMLLACLYLLIWDFDRLKPIFYYKPPKVLPSAIIKETLRKRLRLIFCSGCIALIVFIIVGTTYLFDIIPGNEEAECRNQCPNTKNPGACQVFCDCIYKQGQTLGKSLEQFHKANELKNRPDK